jgi:hypothetical protein
MGEPLKRTTSMKAVVTDPIHLIDAEVSFDQDRTTNDLIIQRHQYIPDDFISDLKSAKIDSKNTRSGDMMLALTVPVSVIEDMKRLYNFDAMEAPIAEVRRMLERLHLDAFIATNKT